MSALIVLGSASAAAAAAGAGWVIRQRWRIQRAEAAMRRRLERAYPCSPSPDKPLPLRRPRGFVALGGDGLRLALGDGEAYRMVPWSGLSEILPVGQGRVSVHISGVGDVVVPGSLGRALWERMGQGGRA